MPPRGRPTGSASTRRRSATALWRRDPDREDAGAIRVELRPATTSSGPCGLSVRWRDASRRGDPAAGSCRGPAGRGGAARSTPRRRLPSWRSPGAATSSSRALVDSVSHDLRTPLATIRAAAGSLADPDIELPADERRTIALAIDTEADRLNRLVGDLLDMSRIQGGALVPTSRSIPLSELVGPAVERASNGSRDATDRGGLSARRAERAGRRGTPRPGRLEPARQRGQVRRGRGRRSGSTAARAERDRSR